MAVGETTEKARDVIANAVGGAASGAATGGGVPGAVGGAAKALVASRRGRRWLMVGLIVAVMSSPVGVVVAVLAFSGLLASTNETVQARSWDLAGALGTSPVSLGTIQAAADSVRTTWQVPWQVVWALWYYETGPGAGWGRGRVLLSRRYYRGPLLCPAPRCLPTQASHRLLPRHCQLRLLRPRSRRATGSPRRRCRLPQPVGQCRCGWARSGSALQLCRPRRLTA